MNNPTKELPGASPFEQRVLLNLLRFAAKLPKSVTNKCDSENVVALDQRLTSLEERVDARLKETRPIWEAVRAQIEKLDEKFKLFIP